MQLQRPTSRGRQPATAHHFNSRIGGALPVADCRSMKAISVTILAVLAITAGYFGVAYFVFPCLVPSFYYANFNQTRNRLAGIPGVEIIDDWQHCDISLEDCGFTLRVNGSEPVRVDFYEGDNWSLPFKRVDGIIVSHPYNPKTNDYEEVLDTAKPIKVARGNHRRPGVWVRIFRDLNRYKRGEQGSADQPTTAPESKPEGVDNPQDEKEPVSR